MKEFKVVILGPGGVGKSALTVQFISGKFVERYDPTVEDFYRKEIEVDGDPAILEILDTAGTEQFASMRDLYIKNGQGFIIVYSLTSRQSFQDIKLIREQILRVKGTDRVPIVLAANKCDLAASSLREVATEEGLCLANEWNIPYVETSAKNSAVVNSLFTEVVKEMNLKAFQSGYGNYGRNKEKKKKAKKQQKQQQAAAKKSTATPKLSNTNTNTTLFSNNSESYASSLKDSALNSSSNVCLKKSSSTMATTKKSSTSSSSSSSSSCWSSCFHCCCCCFGVRRPVDIYAKKSKCAAAVSSTNTSAAGITSTSSNNNIIIANESFVDEKLKQKKRHQSNRSLCSIL